MFVIRQLHCENACGFVAALAATFARSILPMRQALVRTNQPSHEGGIGRFRQRRRD